MTVSAGERHPPRTEARLAKAPSGIRGFDQVTDGGLPRGRPTLVTGASGSGKTMFAVEFLVRGARDYGEPGVLLTFEESADDLIENVASLGFDLTQLERDGMLVIDAIHVDPAEVVATGAFNLDGLFIRLAGAVEEVGAKRVVLDTIEVLFGALGNEGIVRGELARLFRWLKSRGLTAVVTGERGRAGQLTRFGIEEYVSDCVIVLDHRVLDDVSTRRLQVAKYRGSAHGTNEYPFLITDRGVTVLPITAAGLRYGAPTERVSTGLAQLDHLLGGGVYRGSIVMVSGSAGTGKTTLAAQVVDAACARGEQALFVSFEESPDQLVRDMRSVGIDLGRWVDAGVLRMWSERATAFGLESHLGRLERMLEEQAPQVVALDGIASLGHVGSPSEVTSAVTRELDLVKARGITGVLTTLTHESDSAASALSVSSLIDTWLLLRNVETDGERNRLLFVIKSRGTAHSNQVREFVLTDHGAELLEVVVGPRGVATGSARAALLAEEHIGAVTRREDLDQRRAALAQRAAEVAAQIAVLQAKLAAEGAEVDRLAAQETHRDEARRSARSVLGAARGDSTASGDTAPEHPTPGPEEEV
ncbi:circadian clock protein KaiC [Pengzhenrongella frigida]|uniref:Circadian clock protein KaiC n=1 Tax=Pengzhenrongella frigida TaxID=1259133 RepID=A0A4Q5N075_9MICO|nr:circadian clock protein KaiC [Cellulomonas sp. HLT2-17]RYV51420.1 circadian clock protein KaiC [Cellulomonas sp. HLT2-17]